MSITGHFTRGTCTASEHRPSPNLHTVLLEVDLAGREGLAAQGCHQTVRLCSRRQDRHEQTRQSRTGLLTFDSLDPTKLIGYLS